MKSMLMNEGWRQVCQEPTAKRAMSLRRVKVQSSQKSNCKLSGQDKKPVQTAILERGKAKCDLGHWLEVDCHQGCFSVRDCFEKPCFHFVAVVIIIYIFGHAVWHLGS